MYDALFSNSFHFLTLTFDKFHHTDNRKGSPEHYFAYMLCGKCKIVTDSYSVDIQEGDFFYIPDKCSYQSYWYSDTKIRFVSLGFGYFPDFDSKTYPAQTIPYDKESARLFVSLSDLLRLSAADIGIFYTLAGRLIPKMSYTALCRSKEIVEKTKAYLLTHPFAKTAELAKHCTVSEAALYAAFKKSSAITLNTLRNNMLLEKAKNMLISTDTAIDHISDTLGFSSVSYFRKKFKSYFSVSPREMRQKYRI